MDSERSRREFFALALGAAAATSGLSLGAQVPDQPKALSSEFLMDMLLDTRRPRTWARGASCR